METKEELLDQYDELQHQHFNVLAQIAEVRAKILAHGTGTGRRSGGAERRPRGDVLDGMRTVVRVLQAAGEPLRHADLVERAAVELGSVAAWRVRKALAQGYLQKLAHGLYVCAPEMPSGV